MSEKLLAAESPLPVAKTAVQVAEPETPYNRIVWSLAANSRDAGVGGWDAVISMTWIPARQLRDGTVETAPETMRRHVIVSSIVGKDGTLTDAGQRIVELVKLLADSS